MSFYESTSRSDLPELPEFTQLTDRVWRVMGLNPGKFTLQGTNTYLVGTGNRKILIDCGDGQPGYVPLLIESLKSINPKAYISDILISHCHTDHWGGLQHIMSSELNKPLSDTGKKLQNINIHKFPLIPKSKLYQYFYQHLQNLPDYVVFNDLQDNQRITVDEDVHIRVLHTPGHAKDHCAFHLEEEDIVFTADCILGHGSVAFEDLTEYIGSLRKIQDLSPSRLFPGHGDIVNNGTEKVEQYLSQRLAKENQIVDIMLQDTSVTWTPIELTEYMNSVSKKAYSEQLLAVVVRTVGLHLIKLSNDGKIEMIDAKRFKQDTGIDPYDSENIFRIVNQKWKYIVRDSKL
ncbi:beta-lactamase-like protein [Parasitella parasitica]|nr:beta-lactamase-like protein [Parasitella parasitica]